MKVKYLLLLIPLFAVIIVSCNTTEPPIITPPPPDLRKITLTFEDASCTEVWLKIKADSLTLPAELTLKQYIPTGDSLSQIFVLNTQDSVLYVDSLLPNQAYNYQAVLSTDTTIKSEKVTAQTLEPTSHNYTWQTWEFGQHSSSVLYDVAIIDENNIWAVGEIYMNDSLGNPDPIAYNATHWNGNVWELKKINVLFRGSTITPPLEGVFSFSDNDIWFVGSLPIHGDGTNWTMYDLRTTVNPNLSLSKAWGVSSDDIYFVGRNGSIAHKIGTTWTKIESGTTLNIYDIWGDINPNTNEYEVIALASNIFLNQGNKLLQIKNNQVQELNNTSLPWALLTVWFVPERQYYVGGDGLYKIKKLGDGWEKLNEIPPYFKSGIRGQSLNDIVLSGSYGLLMHYNGLDWENYQSTTYLSSGSFAVPKIKNNTICVTGYNGSKAIVFIGKRN